MLKKLPLLLGGLMSLVLGFAFAAPAQAQDPNRFYHYPYHYYPHSYYPNYVIWPDHRRPFQMPPAYMAYPPYREPYWRYDLFESKRYYRGNHFFLDQF